VIAVARSADAILIVLDAGKEGLQKHREILERELETVGIRLNQTKPDVTISTKRKGAAAATGGVRFASTVPQPQLGPEPEKVSRYVGMFDHLPVMIQDICWIL
jgi:uncharacterized protein